MPDIGKQLKIGAGVVAAAFSVVGFNYWNGPERERGTNDPAVTYKLKQIDLPTKGSADTVGDVVENPDRASRLEFTFKEDGNYLINVEVMYTKSANWFLQSKWPGGATLLLPNVKAGDTRVETVNGDFRSLDVKRAPAEIEGIEDFQTWYRDTKMRILGANL